MLKIMSEDMTLLRKGLMAGGAPVMWQRIITDLMPGMKSYVPIGSKVLELGYGDGILTSYLSHNLGWNILGLDVDAKAQILATENAKKYHTQNQVLFYSRTPEEILKHKGSYDAVFVKTVLYGSETLHEYSKRLDWISAVMRPGGIFVNFETGRANKLVNLYRKLRRRVYTDKCLYTREIEGLYDFRFEVLERNYYGGLSQFLAPIPKLYRIAYKIEETVQERNADNCFAVSMIARKTAV